MTATWSAVLTFQESNEAIVARVWCKVSKEAKVERKQWVTA